MRYCSVLLLSRFTNCMVYYALSMNAGSLGDNMYISFALSGLVELPSLVVAYIAVNRSAIIMSRDVSVLSGFAALCSTN